MDSFNKNNINSYLNNTVLILTTVFPLALSMGVCSSIGAFAGIFFSIIASIFADEPKMKMPIYTAFLIISYTFNGFGLSTLSLSIVISGLLLIICSFFCKKLKIALYSPFTSAVMLATALTVTVLFTTDYFGIGADGNTVTEMLASYRSLGFHPNWRGVLYGTIVMVIMITFPRKFKKFCKTVNASFIALALTLILNLFLNPPFMKTAINEIGASSLSISSSIILPNLFEFGKPDILAAVLSGIAMVIPCLFILMSNNAEKKDYIAGGVSNCIFGFSCSMPVPTLNKKKKLASGITAATIIALFFMFGSSLIERIPVHSCAVVLIVGAWQSISGLKLKNTFSNAVSIICFVLCLASCLILGIVHGLIISALIFTVFCIFARSKVTLKDS
ncbi:MAG: hypothetical protein ACI4I3_10315 [Acutalibacteraceae bacterium]